MTTYQVEEPNAKLLRREEARANAEEHFGEALAALRDMVGYGTHLVIRTYNDSDKGHVPMVVVGVLLKQVVAMLDAVDILMREGHSYPALLQVRAAFEASLYVDWILQTDSENRAKHYIVGNLRDEAEWAKRAIPGTTEKVTFDAAMGSVLNHPDPVKLEADARAHLAQVQGILARPEFQSIDATFTTMRANNPFDPAWYKVLGVRTVRRVADAVGRLKEYEVIYGRGSDAMHSGLYKDHIRFKTGSFTMRPLRHLSDANNVFRFAMMARCTHTASS
jgi:Family of unknown function (DUF5677)